jgi:hypothetical protein
MEKEMEDHVEVKTLSGWACLGAGIGFIAALGALLVAVVVLNG